MPYDRQVELAWRDKAGVDPVTGNPTFGDWAKVGVWATVEDEGTTGLTIGDVGTLKVASTFVVIIRHDAMPSQLLAKLNAKTFGAVLAQSQASAVVEGRWCPITGWRRGDERGRTYELTCVGNENA